MLAFKQANVERVDLSGRPYLAYNLKIKQARVGSFDTELVHDFFLALSNEVGMNIHLNQEQGRNAHHIIEAAFKSFARALDAAKKVGDTGPLATGISATASQFLEVLRRHGVTRLAIEPGDEFDPNRHEAVMQQPSPDVEPGRVLLVLSQGFLLHDRVLRPASVIVAST